MDWLTVFNILLVVLSISGESRGGGRKKYRIHIPQKVTHIHHHKKIYITKHLAQHNQPTQFIPQYANPEQYASGYLGSETAALAPTLALLPIAEGRRFVAGSPAPNIQPLYRARGHYGPPIDEPQTTSSNKRIKVIKIIEGGKKKRIIRKKKPKRIIISKGPPPRPHKHEDKDNSHSMSALHDEFYSDVKDNPNTFKRTRKPKRVEKYMDGDTEHIHTYSEEHIHQIVYDSPPIPKAQHPDVPSGLLPLEPLHRPHGPSILHSAVPSSVLPSVIPTSLTIHGATASHLHAPSSFPSSLGSLGTPAHMEYMHYDPRDVTHDHIIHEHGEMTQQLSELNIPTSPKASYNAQGLKLNPLFSHRDPPSHETKNPWSNQDSSHKGTENTGDFSYYENFYKNNKKNKLPSFPTSVHKKPPNPDITSLHKFQEESPQGEFQFEELYPDPMKSPISTYYGNEHKKKPKHKPFSQSSSINVPKKPKFPKSLRQQHYHKAAENKPYSTVASFLDSHSYTGYRNNYKEPKEPQNNYKHYTNIFGSGGSYETDAFGSSTNDHKKENLPPIIKQNWRQNKKHKSNKSVSSQNINFGGQEHKMIINHETSIAMGNSEVENRGGGLMLPEASSPPLSITYPPTEEYYNSQPIHVYEGPSSIPDASNTNFQIVEAPRMRKDRVATERPLVEESSTPGELLTTTPTEPAPTIVSKPSKKIRKKNLEKRPRQKPAESRQIQTETHSSEVKKPLTRGKFKYGDRLNERYDSEYDDLLFI